MAWPNPGARTCPAQYASVSSQFVAGCAGSVRGTAILTQTRSSWSSPVSTPARSTGSSPISSPVAVPSSRSRRHAVSTSMIALAQLSSVSRAGWFPIPWTKMTPIDRGAGSSSRASGSVLVSERPTNRRTTWATGERLDIGPTTS